MPYSLKNKSILVTGGTGSFGQKFVEFALKELSPKKLVIFSRDELKQFDMASRLPEDHYPCIRYFIGDVRDRNRLIRAFSGIDIVIHAAAMKQIVAAEYNPTECIATNVLGAQNVIDAAIENGVEKVVALSTDKAANPINLYGATKLCSDKLFIAANNLSGGQQTRFSVVRYGNVAGSRGSVIPFFKELIASGKTSLPLTHPDMTRFIISLDQGVNLVKIALDEMYGGEIFVPKLPSLKIIDLIPFLGKGLEVHTTGIRPGEKLHEVMIPAEEIRNTVDMGMHFVIQPNHHWWNVSDFKRAIEIRGKPVDGIQEYASNTNPDWLTQEQIADLISKLTV
ncbi:MAG: UDP-N-acetylglucosamine 4,6-dehydratase (inverting) [Candidatus Endolissoclinum sp. TMED37]|nr:MAG: UDP-N-acetylglucosamine 4,6-dehydratase (inverting) [Candidatus Endolissoclinum sp. TMED37]